MLPIEDQILICTNLAELKKAYENLKSTHSKKYAASRGHALETLVLKLLQISGGWERLSKRVSTASGELDLFGVYGRYDFVFELKWTDSKASRPTLQKLESVINNKPNVCGVLISISNQTKGTRDWGRIANSRGNQIVLLDARDLEAVLNEQIPFNYLLEKRLHNARFNFNPQEPNIESAIADFQAYKAHLLFTDPRTLIDEP